MTYVYTLVLTGREIDDVIGALQHRIEGLEQYGNSDYDAKWKSRLIKLQEKAIEEAQNGVDVKEQEEAEKTEREEILANREPPSWKQGV